MAVLKNLQQEMEALRRENEALKAASDRPIKLKVADKGGVSLYGLGRFPVTLYKEQWERLFEVIPEVQAFIVANASKLKTKD